MASSIPNTKGHPRGGLSCNQGENGGGGGNCTRVRRPSALRDYVRSPVSDSPPSMPGAGATTASSRRSRRVSLEHGFPASLFVGAVSVEQAIYGETTRGLSRECQFLIGSCNVPSCFTRPLGPRHATQDVMISVEPIRPLFVWAGKRPSAALPPPLRSSRTTQYAPVRCSAAPCIWALSRPNAVLLLSFLSLSDAAPNFAVGFAALERLALVRTGLALG